MVVLDKNVPQMTFFLNWTSKISPKQHIFWSGQNLSKTTIIFLVNFFKKKQTILLQEWEKSDWRNKLIFCFKVKLGRKNEIDIIVHGKNKIELFTCWLDIGHKVQSTALKRLSFEHVALSPLISQTPLRGGCIFCGGVFFARTLGGI